MTHKIPLLYDVLNRIVILSRAMTKRSAVTRSRRNPWSTAESNSRRGVHSSPLIASEFAEGVNETGDVSTPTCLKWFAGANMIPSTRNSGTGTL